MQLIEIVVYAFRACFSLAVGNVVIVFEHCHYARSCRLSVLHHKRIALGNYFAAFIRLGAKFFDFVKKFVGFVLVRLDVLPLRITRRVIKPDYRADEVAPRRRYHYRGDNHYC